MTINIHTPSSLVKFYSLKPGDVFSYKVGGRLHYFLKVAESEDGSYNCVDLTDSNIGWMTEAEPVDIVQSAELNIFN